MLQLKNQVQGKVKAWVTIISQPQHFGNALTEERVNLCSNTYGKQATVWWCATLCASDQRDSSSKFVPKFQKQVALVITRLPLFQLLITTLSCDVRIMAALAFVRWHHSRKNLQTLSAHQVAALRVH